MEDIDFNISVKDGSVGSRKKIRKVSERTVQKCKRYQNKDPLLTKFKRPCKHSGKTFNCNNIKLSDILLLRKNFYATAIKADQDLKLSYMITTGPVERKRATKPNPRERSFNTLYHLTPKKGTRPTRVCVKFLVKALEITDRRVNIVCKKKFNSIDLNERRGGDQISHKTRDKKTKIIEFIGNLRGCESHYSRSKSKRIYLPANLNIAKLHKMYISKCTDIQEHCSLTMFSLIFRTKFNIGFSSPATDICALCNRLKYKIKMEKDQQKKKNLILQHRIHNKRAKAFYELARESPPDSLTFCFDMQQVQPLPRTPINDAFYSQQVSYYVLCCVDMKAQKPTFYTWTENMAGRGSVEVSSALLAHLSSLDLSNTQKIRLFCDGCGGQNKNAHVMHALYYYLKKQSPESLTEITITFPVRGHSFLPADRVFGRVEKDLRKHTTIKIKKGYDEIYSKFGEVKCLGEDWLLYDVKHLQTFLKKADGISDMKRVVLRKNQDAPITITFFENFRYESIAETPKSLLKKGKKESQLKMELLQLGRPLKEKKKKSLKHLLTQEFGEEWEQEDDPAWYKTILETTEVEIEENQQDEAEKTCDCLEEDVGLHI